MQRGASSGTAEIEMRPGADLVVVPVRQYGRWAVAAVLLVLVILLVRALAHAQIEWSVVRQYLGVHSVLVGLWHTVFISVLSMLLGLVLGVVFAVMRLSDNPVTATVAWFYVWLFRGTPVYLQLLLWFNIALIVPTVGLWGHGTSTVTLMTPLAAALLGLGLNEGAYLAEIIRGGILSVDPGQTDAAAALGMSDLETMRKIVLPQALRVIIPPMGNEFIGLLKTSSLASAISYSEVLFAAERIYTFNSRVMELLIVATLWYLVVVSVFSVGQYYLERRSARGSRSSRPPAAWRRLRDQLGRWRGHARSAGRPDGSPS
jgi:polar amino acid transport system permease protein